MNTDLDELFSVALGAEDIGDYECAKNCYVAILEEDPEFAEAAINLSRIYTDVEGDLDRGIAGLKKVAHLHPIASFNLGVHYQRTNNFLMATKAYQDALALDETLGDAHYNLSGIFNDMGLYATAKRHMEAAKRLGVDCGNTAS